MFSLFQILPTSSQVSPRPRMAVEISSAGVVAGIQDIGGVRQFSFAGIETAALKPGIRESNIVTPQSLVRALDAALDRIAGRHRQTTLILPDASVRILILDFDTLPTKLADAKAVVRFRLRRLLPFDADEASISWQALPPATNGQMRILVTAIPAFILAEYEDLIRDAGYEPGAVLPSSLAALAAHSSLESEVLVHRNGESLITAIVSGENLLLHRTLDLPQNSNAQIELQRDVAVALAYFEDTLSLRPSSLVYSGHGSAQDFAALLNEPELTVHELAAPEATIPSYLTTAPVLGALLGAVTA